MKKLAILGPGVVGGSCAEILLRDADLLERNAGEQLELAYVLARRALPDRPYKDKVVTDFSVIERDANVFLVIETIGGCGAALEYVRRALAAGKHVVTANKQLIAEHGAELLALAKANGVSLLFEASVGGGIPVLHPLSQCLGANEIYEVRGILNGKAAADDLPARMDVMNKRIADLLRQSGFPADYLDPVYRCKQCRDTGYVGEPIREMCPCLRSAFYARLYREVGLGEKAEQSFAAFDPNVFSDQPLPGKKYSQRQLMDMLRHQCEQYAEKYPNAATMDLLLMGQSGLGKTYLMHAIAKRLLERGFNVMMISAYRFLDVARRAYFSGKQEEMDTLMDTDVLMIDDMGVEPLMENITIVQWFNLINERQLRGKGTVISTNLNVEELRRRYTERITSRLLDGKQCMLLQFLGDDVRRNKA